MKVNLLEIEKRERIRGRGFMNRMKDAWDVIYVTPMSTQCLRDNAARFRKDKSILNLTEVREIEKIEPQLGNVILNRNKNIQEQIQDQIEVLRETKPWKQTSKRRIVEKWKKCE